MTVKAGPVSLGRFSLRDSMSVDSFSQKGRSMPTPNAEDSRRSDPYPEAIFPMLPPDPL